MLKIKYLNSSFLIAIGLLATFSACKKEYLKAPYAHIETFSLTDDKGNTVMGSVDQDTIIVYWAPFKTIPETVTTQIALAPGASVSPASGSKVDFKTGTTFTVTAQDGSLQKYYLKTVINEPAPDFETNRTEFALGSSIGLSGQYFIPDTSRTKFYLIDAFNNSTAVFINPFSKLITTRASILIPFSIDTGYYHLKVVSGNNTTIKGPLHFTYPTELPLSSPDFGKKLKRGGQITLTYDAAADKYFDHTNAKAQVRITTDEEFNTPPIVIQSPGTIKITIPKDAPLGSIYGIYLFHKDEEFYGDFYTPNGQEPITIVE